MAEDNAQTQEQTAAPVVKSPPPAAQPAKDGLEPKLKRLAELAKELSQTRSRSALIEYLTLRRSVR